MARLFGRTAAIAAAAVVLAGCGGSGGAAAEGASAGPGKPGEWKAKMGEVMKPCGKALKNAETLAGLFKAGKASQGEAVEATEAAVAACESAHGTWAAYDMPAEVAEPCMKEAQARLDGAWATRNALNHMVSPPYKKRMSIFADRAKRFETACKTAVKEAKV